MKNTAASNRLLFINPVLIVGLVLAGGSVLQAEEWLQNPSFDEAGGAHWQLADDEDVSGDLVFASPGQADLETPFRGRLIWQNLNRAALPGEILRAQMTLANQGGSVDISTQLYLDYQTRAGELRRVPVLQPLDTQIGSLPSGTTFEATFRVPWDAHQLMSLSVERSGPAEIIALGFSLQSVGQVIIIASVEDLQKIGYDEHYPLDGWYALAGDIDASETATWNEGSGFLPIGGVDDDPEPFTGIFEGNGYKITDLTIHQPALNAVGLFRQTGADAIIRQIGMVGGSVGGKTTTGGGRTGPLVGFQDGLVEQCFAEVDVVGYNFAGGLIGESVGIVRDSFARGSVNSYFRAGGLIGFAMNGTLENCFAATVLLPWGIQWGQFDSLAGMWDGTGSYGDSDVASSADGVGVSGFSSEEMTYPYAEGIYGSWNFESVWIADVDNSLNDGYPYLRSAMTPFAGGLGTAEYPFLVATAGQLNRVRDFDWAHFLQVADIDLGVAPWNEGEGWEPIGSLDWETWTGGFAGVYDGNGYAISNIFQPDILEGADTEISGGLFSQILAFGILRNIHLDGGNIGMRFWDAAALASMNSGLIEDCLVSTTVAYSYEGGAGMVVGNYGTIRNCTFSGSVDGGHWVGGLVAMNAGTIENSHFTGFAGANYHTVGGIAGFNEGLIRDSSPAFSTRGENQLFSALKYR